MRIALLVVAALGVAAIIRAVADDGEPPCLPGGPDCPVPSPPCDEAGTRDLNPTNRNVEPRHDVRLLARGAGHRLPFGFNDEEPVIGRLGLEQDLALHRGVGSTLWRLRIDWGAIQRTPQGALDFELVDAIYCAGVQAGVRPVLRLVGTPTWAADSDRACQVPCLVPPRQAAYPALRRFAEVLAIRYPHAAAAEVWNEPNHASYWRSGPDPARYVELLREVYTGVKNGNPRLPVLGGSLSTNPTDNPTTGDLSRRTFLQGMEDNDAGEFMDAVSIHAYPTVPLNDPREQFEPALQDARSAATTSDDWPQHLWITEVGMATPPGAPWSPPVSEEMQATVLLDVYRRLAADPDVDAVLFHTLVEPDPARIPYGPGFGWVGAPEAGLAPKPVYCAFAVIAGRQPDGC